MGPQHGQRAKGSQLSLPDLKQRLAWLLEKHGTIHGGRLMSMYVNEYHEPLNCANVAGGYHRVKDLLMACKDVVKMTKGAGGHMILSKLETHATSTVGPRPGADAVVRPEGHPRPNAK